MKAASIPLKIHPLFWVTAALIGMMSGSGWMGTFLLIAIIFLSVLVHEMGHGLMARFFGLFPQIELSAFGGMTFYEGGHLPFWKQFLIVICGPLVGFLLCIGAFILMRYNGWTALIPAQISQTMMIGLLLIYKVNLFWTIINLIPVLPLDGGQLIRIILEASFGAKGVRYALVVGMVMGGGVSLFFFLLQHYLIGGLFFLFAFQSFDAFRRMKKYSENDRSASLKKKLEEAENFFHTQEREKALFAFEELKHQTQKGFIYTAACQYIAFLKAEKGSFQEIYDLLTPLRKELSPEALMLLQKAAFEIRDFSLVEEIGPSCFQYHPSQEIALRTARACALLGKAKPAVGWLEAAFQEGLEKMGDILRGEEFNSIRDTDVFKSILNRY